MDTVVKKSLKPGVMALARLCNNNGWYAPSQAHCRLGRIEIWLCQL
ncbi:hypothetical protein SLEP1_g9120 [Rubroshorea leprosula]|uniref:Uncharacterized protein n=1 Tax=Rubroshorea leprosula TaxID=152421 RepID=A0AAV5ID31_9ROSI|nr:hypothetical protein SLEP1_g9120 [Rubroshorea leprosula]